MFVAQLLLLFRNPFKRFLRYLAHKVVAPHPNIAVTAGRHEHCARAIVGGQGKGTDAAARVARDDRGALVVKTHADAVVGRPRDDHAGGVRRRQDGAHVLEVECQHRARRLAARNDVVHGTVLTAHERRARRGLLLGVDHENAVVEIHALREDVRLPAAEHAVRGARHDVRVGEGNGDDGVLMLKNRHGLGSLAQVPHPHRLVRAARRDDVEVLGVHGDLAHEVCVALQRHRRAAGVVEVQDAYNAVVAGGDCFGGLDDFDARHTGSVVAVLPDEPARRQVNDAQRGVHAPGENRRRRRGDGPDGLLAGRSCLRKHVGRGNADDGKQRRQLAQTARLGRRHGDGGPLLRRRLTHGPTALRSLVYGHDHFDVRLGFEDGVVVLH
eukprot:PhM_4_TR16068/c0_g1_i1/m.39239